MYNLHIGIASLISRTVVWITPRYYFVPPYYTHFFQHTTAQHPLHTQRLGRPFRRVPRLGASQLCFAFIWLAATAGCRREWHRSYASVPQPPRDRNPRTAISMPPPGACWLDRHDFRPSMQTQWQLPKAQTHQASTLCTCVFLASSSSSQSSHKQNMCGCGARAPLQLWGNMPYCATSIKWLRVRNGKRPLATCQPRPPDHPRNRPAAAGAASWLNSCPRKPPCFGRSCDPALPLSRAMQRPAVRRIGQLSAAKDAAAAHRRRRRQEGRGTGGGTAAA